MNDEDEADAMEIYAAVKPSDDEPELTGELPELSARLHRYQRRSAAWMVRRELAPQVGSPQPHSHIDWQDRHGLSWMTLSCSLPVGLHSCEACTSSQPSSEDVFRALSQLPWGLKPFTKSSSQRPTSAPLGSGAELSVQVSPGVASSVARGAHLGRQDLLLLSLLWPAEPETLCSTSSRKGRHTC